MIAPKVSLIFLLAPLCLMLSETSAQNLAPEARRTPKVTNMMNGMPFAKPAPGIEGSTYFNSHWDKVNISIKDLEEPMDDFYGRYGIYSDEVEVKTPQGVKAIPSSRIKSLVFTDSLLQIPIKFISVMEFDFEGTHLNGLFQLLSDGKMKLLKAHKVIVRQPDYNPALNTGSKDIQIIKESELYCTHNNELLKVKNKKKLLPLFDDKAPQMETYMKENKLGASEKDLIKTFDYFNSLN